MGGVGDKAEAGRQNHRQCHQQDTSQTLDAVTDGKCGQGQPAAHPVNLAKDFRRINARSEVFMIVSVGVMLMMNGVIRLAIGPDGRDFEDGERFIVTARGGRDWSGLAEPLMLKTSQVLTIGLAVAAGVALFWFLNRTQAGQSMHAYADNRNLALLSGVDPDRNVRLTWILVAVLAGVLFGLDKGYRPFVYQQLLLPMFAAAVVGGLGSPFGAIVGSMIVAISELALTFPGRRR